MDLYDDLDTKKQLDGWSSGIKMLQTQLAIKKATLPPPKKEPPKKPSLMTPTVTLNKPKKMEDLFSNSERPHKPETKKNQIQVTIPAAPQSTVEVKNEWDFVDEYNPLWPNEYEKLIKDKRDREREKDKRDDYHRDRRKRITKVHEDSPPVKLSGFAGRSNDEDSYEKSPPTTTTRSSGAAIAPPLSLQESIAIIPEKIETTSNNVPTSYGSSSVAAKIMAKYGFKDGQGLGKQEQGMSIALQVEKTSKRGGRIIHEKELFVSPLPPPSPPAPAPAPTPAPVLAPPPIPAPPVVIEPTKSEPSITEIMKSPSKVVLLRNMVGPGDVDAELEPEVKDECNTKYGDVISVAIHEVVGVVAEEAVRIFVEFKRIESAIKAVVDLNGRFFGGRQVKAGFYDFNKYKTGQIHD